MNQIFGRNYMSLVREENDNPLQYSYMENPMDKGAWWATDHGVAKSWTPLSGDSTHQYILFIATD